MIESTNVSVGRGTNTPFELIGAPWIDAKALSEYLNTRLIAGVRFVPISFTPTTGPYMNQVCGGVNFIVTDRNVLDAPEMGVELASALRNSFPITGKSTSCLPSRPIRAWWMPSDAATDPRNIAQSWQDDLPEIQGDAHEVSAIR